MIWTGLYFRVDDRFGHSEFNERLEGIEAGRQKYPEFKDSYDISEIDLRRTFYQANMAVLRANLHTSFYQRHKHNKRQDKSRITYSFLTSDKYESGHRKKGRDKLRKIWDAVGLLFGFSIILNSENLYKYIFLYYTTMFYEIDVEDYVRVEPKLFGLKTSNAVAKQLQETYSNYHDKEIGEVIGVISVSEVGDGIIIPGDGAAYYNSKFKLIVWKPEMQELTFGIIDEITNFGAFMNLGVMQGMIHISQTMEDFVSFSTTNTLLGKDSKKVLKKGDACLARVVAISYKGDDPKIGLTMRQPGLGKVDWIKEEKKKNKAVVRKALNSEKEDKKGKK
jgi:DNA-directed RNA polymerase subunit E'